MVSSNGVPDVSKIGHLFLCGILDVGHHEWLPHHDSDRHAVRHGCALDTCSHVPILRWDADSQSPVDMLIHLTAYAAPEANRSP